MSILQSASNASAWRGNTALQEFQMTLGPALPVPNEHDFAQLNTAYAASGGMARANDLARLREEPCCDYCMSLEKLIALRAVFGFDWQRTYWVPMFQFQADLRLKPGPRKVLAEVASVCDGWSLALWFVRPCPRLNAQTPVALVDSNLPDVLQAARDDRRMLNRSDV